MAAPDLMYNYEDLLLRVAEFLGWAEYSGSKAAIPSDEHDLDVCKRIVNEGWRQFINSKPHWNWQQYEHSITFDPDGTGSQNVNGEAWRYYMPDGFYGRMLSDFRYTSTDRPYTHLVNVNPEDIERKRSVTTTYTGTATEYGLRPISGDTQGRWEAIFYPTPGSAYVVAARCHVYPNRLIELNDRPNCPVQFHQAVLASCLARAELTRNDVAGHAMEDFNIEMQRAIAMDLDLAPRRIGTVHRSGRHGWYDGVDAYYDIDGTEVAEF